MRGPSKGKYRERASNASKRKGVERDQNTDTSSGAMAASAQGAWPSPDERHHRSPLQSTPVKRLADGAPDEAESAESISIKDSDPPERFMRNEKT